MSAENFLKDLKDYFVDFEFSLHDERKVLSLFKFHQAKSETVIYKDRIVEKHIRVPFYAEREKILYMDSTTGKVIGSKEVKKTLQKDIDQMINDICGMWGVTREEVTSNTKTNRLVYPRYFMFHALRGIGLTYTEIGRIFHRDHSTVMEGIKKADIMVEMDCQPFARLWNEYNSGG